MTGPAPLLQQLARAQQQASAAPSLPAALQVLAEAALAIAGARRTVLDVVGPNGRVRVSAPGRGDGAPVPPLLPAAQRWPLWVGGRLVGLLRVVEPGRHADGPAGGPDEVAAALQLLAGTAALAVAGALPAAPPQPTAHDGTAGFSALSGELGRLVLAGPVGLQRVVATVQESVGADLVAIVTPQGADLRMEAITGPQTAQLIGARYPRAGSLVDAVLTDGAAVVRDGARPDDHPSALLDAIGIGAALAVPLGAGEDVRGALLLARLVGAPSFDDADLERCRWIAGQVALALDVREERGRALDADRDRIARDLHDLVIQRLYGAGLIAQGVLGALVPPQADRIATVVEAIDEAIRQIRVTVFALTGSRALAGDPVRARLRAVTREVGALLAGEPELRFDGPVDTVVDEQLADDLEAVLREALTNVARHAGAGHVGVELRVDGDVVRMTVTDDGVGPADTSRSSGLRNLRERATARGGGLDVVRGQDGSGTVLRWWVPLVSDPTALAAGR